MATPRAHASGLPEPEEVVPEPEAQTALLNESFESVQHPGPPDAVPAGFDVATRNLRCHSTHLHVARSPARAC